MAVSRQLRYQLPGIHDVMRIDSGLDRTHQRNGGFADHVVVPHPRYLVPYGALPKADTKARAEGKIAYPIKDFYLTNPIARSSPTMQRCSAELLHGEDFAEAAE